MASSLRFLAVGLLMAGADYRAAAQSQPPRSSTGNTTFPFFVGAQWFEGDYELLGLPNLPTSVAPSGYENAVKPWQLTVGRNVSSRLVIQVGYTYASTRATENTAYTNSAGQLVNSSVRYETLINSLPWLGRYDLTPRSHAMHVDLLLGITGLTAQSIVSSEDRINGQVVASQRTTSRISRLYGTGGVGCYYPFGRRIDGLLDLTLSRVLRTAETSGNILGATWAGGIGLRYHFAVPKKAAGPVNSPGE